MPNQSSENQNNMRAASLREGANGFSVRLRLEAATAGQVRSSAAEWVARVRLWLQAGKRTPASVPWASSRVNHD